MNLFMYFVFKVVDKDKDICQRSSEKNYLINTKLKSTMKTQIKK